MNKPSVAVLMSTYNGEKYLQEQIQSILTQTYANFHLFIRDDHSSDHTIDILNSYKYNENVTIILGDDNLGYKNSFLYLLKLVIDGNTQEFDYFAFSDQDDVWKNNKIKVGISKLNRDTQTENQIYFSSLIFVDDRLNTIRLKDESDVITSFGGEIVRHSISGATVIFTKHLGEMLVSYDDVFGLPGGHDALLFRLNAALGGDFISDKDSYILFRRHSGNVSNATRNTLYKVFSEFKSDEHTVSKTLRFLHNRFDDKITDSNKLLLQQLLKYDRSFSQKIKVISNKQFRRENMVMNIIFFVRVFMGKI